MKDMFLGAEADGACADMDTTGVRTEERTGVSGLPYADGNILDTMAAASCSAAWANMTYHAVSEAGALASGHTVACLMDGGS